MAEPILTIRPAELSAEILKGSGRESTARVAQALREFLQERQPQLSALVTISACPGQIVVRASGEHALDTLRSVEGVLGMEDRLPEALPFDEMPEIEANEKEFSLEATKSVQEPAARKASLRSKVRYFPTPICEWFEISDGELLLEEDRLVFKPKHQIVPDSGASPEGVISIEFENIKDFGRDVWWNVPCLGIETEQKAFRFGWPPRREEPESIFQIEEWLDTLRRLLGRRE